MNHFLSTLLFLFLCTSAFSQSIKGKVIGQDGAPLPFANVLLLHGGDSTLIKGAVSDSLGMYALDNIRTGSYLLASSSIGYKQSEMLSVSVNPNVDVALQPLMLMNDSQQLNEVVVLEKRPFVEQYVDKMVINVANSIIASGSTALEVLEKAPGITVDRQNSAILLRGKEGVMVQMNGKRTYLSMLELVNMLQSMSSDEIDQIELITNPSAKYDASGNSGIINIKMKKNSNVGSNGSVALGIGTGKYIRQRGSLMLNHRTKAFNAFGSFGENIGGNYFDLANSQTIGNATGEQFGDQSTFIKFSNRGQNASAGIDFFLGQNSTLGVLWRGFWSDNGEDGTASSVFSQSGVETPYLEAHTDKAIGNIAANHVANINFQHNFNNDGGTLSMDVDYGHFNRAYSNTLATSNTSLINPVQPIASLLVAMPTIIEIQTAKIDFSKSLSSSWKMETGLKSSHVASDNDMTLSKGDNGNLVIDNDLSNHFQYDEQVYAAYASFSGKIGDKTQMQGGLRAEHTTSEALSITLNDAVKRKYLNLFPSVFVSQKLSENHSLVLSYSYRIDRPNYQALNPARSYVDPYIYSEGNQFLIPMYTHSFELKHGFKDKIFTSLGASYVDDVIFYVIQPIDSIRTMRKPDNFGSSQSYNLTVSFPVAITKGWNAQINMLGLFSEFSYNYLDQPTTVQQFSARMNASNTLSFGGGWTGEVTGWISAPGIYIIQKSPWL